MASKKELTCNKYRFDTMYKKIVIEESYRPIIICQGSDNNEKVIIECFEGKRSAYKFVSKEYIKIISPMNSKFAKNEVSDEYLKISVPEGRIFDIEIKGNQSNISIGDIYLSDIYIQNTNGVVNINGVHSKAIEIKSTETYININKSFVSSKINMKNTAMPIVLNSIEFPTAINIENTSGNISLSLDGEPKKHKLSLKSERGEVKVCDVNFEEYKSPIYLGSRKKVKAKTISGNIDIFFNEEK